MTTSPLGPVLSYSKVHVLSNARAPSHHRPSLLPTRKQAEMEQPNDMEQYYMPSYAYQVIPMPPPTSWQYVNNAWWMQYFNYFSGQWEYDGPYFFPGFPSVQQNKRIEANNPIYGVVKSKVVSGEETRTTMMVRNIPNQLKRQDVMDRLDLCISGGYNVVYLPIDFKSKNNFGYYFVNLKDPENVIALIHEFEGTKWPSNDSPKQCHVEYSRLQGKDELLMEYERHANHNQIPEEWRPWIEPVH